MRCWRYASPEQVSGERPCEAESTTNYPLFHVFSVEDRIRPDHPLRDIKRRVDRILAGMSAVFTRRTASPAGPACRRNGCSRRLLLMALYSVRSERQLCERIDTDLLFRWFLDLQPSDEAFDATTFTHNRQRLDDHDLTQAFFAAVVERRSRRACAASISASMAR